MSGALLGECPVPRSQYEQIMLGHGSGGRLTAELIQRLFVPAFANDVLSALEDQATLPLIANWPIGNPQSAIQVAVDEAIRLVEAIWTEALESVPPEAARA